jgi:hypothetical protein
MDALCQIERKRIVLSVHSKYEATAGYMFLWLFAGRPIRRTAHPDKPLFGLDLASAATGEVVEGRGRRKITLIVSTIADSYEGV